MIPISTLQCKVKIKIANCKKKSKVCEKRIKITYKKLQVVEHTDTTTVH